MTLSEDWSARSGGKRERESCQKRRRNIGLFVTMIVPCVQRLNVLFHLFLSPVKLNTYFGNCRLESFCITEPSQSSNITDYRCFGIAFTMLFLPRDAMLARYLLSSCVRSSVRLSVCLSVCHKPVLYRNDWTGLRFGMEASFCLSHTML